MLAVGGRRGLLCGRRGIPCSRRGSSCGRRGVSRDRCAISRGRLFDEEDGNGDDNSGRANDHDRGNGETATPQTSTFEAYGVSFCYRFFIDNRTPLNPLLFFVHFSGRNQNQRCKI